jgi:hypothetical protein
MSPQFLAEVDRLAKARGESRAAFIRCACEHFISELREQELEALYEQGYREHPEELVFAKVAADLAAETWPDEDWSEEPTSTPKGRGRKG